jgi:hypothetical protein
MLLYDKNQSWLPPTGFVFRGIVAEGAYLRVEYWRSFANGDDIAVIYLNDMGREVTRTMTTVYLPPPALLPPTPVGRRFRIRNGFLLALEGIQEMAKSWRKT